MPPQLITSNLLLAIDGSSHADAAIQFVQALPLPKKLSNQYHFCADSTQCSISCSSRKSANKSGKEQLQDTQDKPDSHSPHNRLSSRTDRRLCGRAQT